MRNVSLTLPVSVLKKYMRPVFVETGTFSGGGIDVAKKAGAQRIISIEINETYWRAQAERFVEDPSVTVVLGDSGVILWDVIEEIDTQIVFWLDGHIGHSVPGVRGIKDIPIIEELSQIGRHKRHDHVIMVDDRSQMGRPIWGGVTERHVIDAIAAINPRYSLVLENGKEIRGDILVAVPPV